MRWINTSRVQRHLPSDWLKESKALLDQLIAAPNRKARSAIINSNSAHWNEIRKALWTIGGEKCWYTEMVIPWKSSVIEHFRPKGKLAQESHDGYWWLSFNWKNFRISSHAANVRVTDAIDKKTKGKGTYFPLVGGARVSIYSPTAIDELSIGSEEALLLDPLKPRDVGLLTFNHDGLPVANSANCVTPKEVLRVTESIGLYCLDEGTMNAERADLWRRVLAMGSKIEELEQKRSLAPLSTQDEYEYERSMTELAGLVDKSASFSATAIAAVKSLGSRGWTEGILTI